jgi:hypothetical protein
MNSAILKTLLASVVGILAPEAKVLLDTQLKPFLDKEIYSLTGGDWHDMAKIFEAAFIQAGDVELAKAAVKLTQIAGAAA